MKFISYNIRNALMSEDDQRDNWRLRRDALATLIEKANPDILALQEDSDEQLRYLEAKLKKSHTVYCDPAFYEADSSYNAIFVRNTLAVLMSGAFWITEDGKAQSKLASSICLRHAAYVRVRISGRTLTIVNVHLDHATDREFKKKEAAVFIQALSALSRKPYANTIILGDLNAVSDKYPNPLLENSGFLDVAKLCDNERPTYIDWGRDPGRRIDYVWLSEDLEGNLQDYHLLEGVYRREDGSQGYASDHAAVVVELSI